MILVIGKENCNICEVTKQKLDELNINYEYKLLNELENKKHYIQTARKHGQMAMPILFNNDQYTTLQEIIDKNILRITKRNGDSVVFDKQRIVNAINNAMFETGEIDNNLSEMIAHEIETEISSGVKVEDIQDIIEEKLVKYNRKDTKVRFNKYREIKNKERKRKDSLPQTGNQLLTDEFISKYKHMPNPMTQLGSFVYYRTYSRWLPELNRREYWWETVRRAVEYNCSLAKTTKEEAEELYDNIFNLRQFLSGRTLFTGGTKVSKNYALSNFNCALRRIDSLEAFGEVFYILMLGTGSGVRVILDDVKNILPVRKDIELIHKEYKGLKKRKRQENSSLISKNNTIKIVVGDSKEAWKEALDMYFKVISSHTYNNIGTIIVDYDNVRPKGERLKTFGGRASGFESIMSMFTKIHKVISNIEGERFVKLRPIDALDICNIVGENVVSGGVRRTSEVGIFDKDNLDILNAKSNLYKLVGDKWVEDTDISFRKMSNNSIFYKQKPSREELHKHLETLRYNGEPGFINEEAGKKRRDNFKGLNPLITRWI